MTLAGWQPRQEGICRHSQPNWGAVGAFSLLVPNAGAGRTPTHPAGSLAEGCSVSTGMGTSGMRHRALWHPGDTGTNAGVSEEGITGEPQALWQKVPFWRLVVGAAKRVGSPWYRQAVRGCSSPNFFVPNDYNTSFFLFSLFKMFQKRFIFRNC